MTEVAKKREQIDKYQAMRSRKVSVPEKQARKAAVMRKEKRTSDSESSSTEPGVNAFLESDLTLPKVSWIDTVKAKE